MIRSESPWWRLLFVWLPAVLLCIAMIGIYVWQSSETLGRARQRRTGIEELRTVVERYEGLKHDVETQNDAVEALNQEISRLRDDVFGDLGRRLTRIMREVGLATRSAGLLPGRFSYSVAELRDAQLMRFEVQFAVVGRYEQIRRMLAALQGSGEFLIVDRISFAGEEQAVSDELRISVQISTYLTEADSETLARITDGGFSG